MKNVSTNLSNLKNKVDKLDVDKLLHVAPVDLSIITNLATNTTLNTKINEVKCKRPNITNLASTTALNAVENKIPVSNLTKKSNYKTTINEIKRKVIADQDHHKYITTQ